MFNLGNARASHFMPIMTVIALSALRLFGFQGNSTGTGIFLPGRQKEATDIIHHPVSCSDSYGNPYYNVRSHRLVRSNLADRHGITHNPDISL